MEPEEQLQQAQKMEAIGQLTGGIAHDFNNMLTVILSYASMMLLRLPPGDPMRSEAQEIVTAGERAGELTRQLLAFSRQQVLQPRIIDLTAVVQGLSTMLRRLIGEEVELTIRCPNDLTSCLLMACLPFLFTKRPVDPRSDK